MPTLNNYINTRGFIGLASEITHGTPVTSQIYTPILSESLIKDPGIILDKLIRNTKDEAFAPAVGEQKIEGSIDTLFYLDNSLMPMAAAIGTDAYILSSAAGTFSATGNSVAVGATTISLTAQTSPALAANSFFEIKQAMGAEGATNLSEVHKVLSVSGTGPYVITLAGTEKFQYAYTATAQIANVPAGSAVTHNFLPDVPDANTFKTLTIEKNFAGLASQQFAGSIVSKASLKTTTKETCRATYAMFCAQEANITPSTPSFLNTTPISLTNYSISLFGSPDTSVTAFDLEIDNSGKGYWTYNNNNLPAIVIPTARKVTGKFSNVAQSMTYYNQLATGSVGVNTFTITQGTSIFVFNMPQAVITKFGAPLKVGDVLMFDVDFQCTVTPTTGNSISGSFQSTTAGYYLPLV